MQVSVKELVAEIECFVDRYNAEAQPFSWTATPDSVLEKSRFWDSRRCSSVERQNSSRNRVPSKRNRLSVVCPSLGYALSGVFAAIAADAERRDSWQKGNFRASVPHRDA